MLGAGQNRDVDLAARVARLTPGQKACLDLVDDHATSKEIAVRLGISRHTVDARLRQAIQILGVTSRREAAVIWRTAASAEGYQPFTYQPSEIVSRPDAQDDEPAHRTEDDHDGSRQQAGDRAGDSAPDAPVGPAPDGVVPPPPGFVPPIARPFAPLGWTTAPGGYPPSAYPPVMPAPDVWPSASGYPPAGYSGNMPSADTHASEVRDAIGWGYPGAAPLSQMPAHSVLPRLWGGANDLSIAHRLVGILIVMVLGMLAFGLLLSGIGALTQLRL